MDHTSKVLDAELALVTVLRRDVVCVEFVLGVEFVQHGGISSLNKTYKQQEIMLLKHTALHTAIPRTHFCVK